MGEIEKLMETRAVLLKRLTAKAGWIQGSVVETMAGRGSDKRPFRYLSRSAGGKNRVTYISDAESSTFKKAATAWRAREVVIEKISETNGTH